MLKTLYKTYVILLGVSVYFWIWRYVKQKSTKYIIRTPPMK